MSGDGVEWRPLSLVELPCSSGHDGPYCCAWLNALTASVLWAAVRHTVQLLPSRPPAAVLLKWCIKGASELAALVRNASVLNQRSPPCGVSAAPHLNVAEHFCQHN